MAGVVFPSSLHFICILPDMNACALLLKFLCIISNHTKSLSETTSKSVTSEEIPPILCCTTSVNVKYSLKKRTIVNKF